MMKRWTIAHAMFLLVLFVAPLLAQNVDDAKRLMAEVEVERGPLYRTEAGSNLFTQALVERLACVDDRWGRKSRNGGPISFDRIAYRLGPMTPDGRNVAMRVIDYCIACGVPTARLGWIDEGVITDQQFWPVACTGVHDPVPVPPSPPTPAPTPPPTPVPSVDLTPIMTQAAQQHLAEMARLAELQAQLQRHDEEPMWVTKFLRHPVAQGIIAVIGTCAATQCWQPKR